MYKNWGMYEICENAGAALEESLRKRVKDRYFFVKETGLFDLDNFNKIS